MFLQLLTHKLQHLKMICAVPLQLRRKDRKTGTPLQADFISFGYEISLSSVRIPKNKKLKQAKEASPGYLSK